MFKMHRVLQEENSRQKILIDSLKSQVRQDIAEAIEKAENIIWAGVEIKHIEKHIRRYEFGKNSYIEHQYCCSECGANTNNITINVEGIDNKLLENCKERLLKYAEGMLRCRQR